MGNLNENQRKIGEIQTKKKLTKSKHYNSEIKTIKKLLFCLDFP
jgi:hypothetical protein